MLINHEDLQKDGYTIVTARALAAASTFVEKKGNYRPILSGILIETSPEGTFLTSTDSYRAARIRSQSYGKNPEGANFIVRWADIKNAKLLTASPKQSMWVALKHFEPCTEHPRGYVRVKVLEKQVVGFETRGEAICDGIEGSFPDWNKIEGHQAMIDAKEQSNVSCGVNVNYVIDIFNAIKLAVSDCGPAVTQFIHGPSVNQPIYFKAENASGESIWTIQMPVRL